MNIELLNLGQKIFVYLDSLVETVAVIVSSDLAHTHQAEVEPYGTSPAAELFDQAVGNWAKFLEDKYLLEDAAKYAPEALSCGFTGLIMIQGMMQYLGLEKFISRLYALEHPSYYGMMVSSFVRKKTYLK